MQWKNQTSQIDSTNWRWWKRSPTHTGTRDDGSCFGIENAFYGRNNEHSLPTFMAPAKWAGDRWRGRERMSGWVSDWKTWRWKRTFQNMNRRTNRAATEEIWAFSPKTKNSKTESIFNCTCSIDECKWFLNLCIALIALVADGKANIFVEL